MKTVTRLMLILIGVSLLALCPIVKVQAQDPVKLAPENYQVLFDNDKIRVLEVRLEPFKPMQMHSHPAHLIYALTNFTLKLTLPDGQLQLMQYQSGDLDWSPAVQYEVENVGDAPALAVMCEFKEPILIAKARGAERARLLRAIPEDRPVPVAQPEKPHHRMLTPDQVTWIDNDPKLPRGTKSAVLEGNPAQPGHFTMRLWVPAGTKVAPHWHPSHEQITVISGSIHMGLGDVFDKNNTKKYPAGSFLMMPAESRHFVWMDEDTVVQIHGMGPWGMTHVNPADDPRKREK